MAQTFIFLPPRPREQVVFAMSLFADADGLWPTVAATSYSLLAGGVGLWLLATHSGVLLTLLGVLLAAHGRVVAAYLLHDAAHSSARFSFPSVTRHASRLLTGRASPGVQGRPAQHAVRRAVPLAVRWGASGDLS